MSLIAWFPLNGSLINQGTSNSIMTNYGATVTQTGKVTYNCYLFNGESDYMTASLPTFTPFTQISISLWYYLSSYNSYSPILGFGEADSVHGLWFRHGDGASNLRIEYGDGSKNYDKDTGATSSLNTWYNLAVIYDGINIKAYRDGVQLCSYPAPSAGIATNSILQLATFWAGKAKCKINDVRVYDHALSTKEIKELAKGLCLHYTFDDIGNQNILAKEQANQYQTSSEYGFASVNVGKLETGTYTLTANGRTNYTNTSWGYLIVYIYSAGWTAGEVFTMSFQNIKENTTLSLQVPISWPQKDTIIASYYSDGSKSPGDNGSATINWYKLEKGNYSTYFYNTDKIIDNSGYKNNGTLYNINNFKLVTDTNLGNQSLYCADCGHTSRIETNLTPSFITNGTVCFWYKKNTAAFEHNDGCFIAATGVNGTWLAATQTNTEPPFNSSCSYSKWYIDGIENKSSYITDTDWHFYCYTGVNLSQWTEFNIHKHGDAAWCFRGNISDYRIFATALSETDIKDLYTAKAAIHNTGNLETYNFEETDTEATITSKKGISYSSEIYEYPHIELEYIESTGTQYIDTGYKNAIGFSIKLLAAITNKDTLGDFFGFNGDANEAFLRYNTNGYAFWSNAQGSSSYTDFNFSLDTIYDIECKFASTSYFKVNGQTIRTLSTTASYRDVNIPLFAENSNTSGIIAGLAKIKLHSCQIYSNTGTLVRDFIPVKKSDGAVCLFDKLTNAYYYNKGTGNFLAGPEKEIHTLNIYGGYEILEYIESTGTQYIDTGYSNSEGFAADIKFMLTSVPSESNGYIIGCHNLSSPYGRNGFQPYYGQWQLGHGDVYPVGGTPIANILYNGEVNTKKGAAYLKLNGETVITDNGTTTLSSLNVLLFTDQYVWTNNQKASYAKLYSCKIYTPGKTQLVRDFVPARRKSDNAIGLLNTLNNKFYENSGTGNFIAGPIKGEFSLIKCNELIEN